eukprot:Skav207188  [mRNA]  locus=scaffold4046:27596:28618:+ [translate_table: standard]
MDFRHVEPKFQKTALVVQMLLVVILLLSAANSVRLILQSSEPPVESSVALWNKGVGKWAICSTKSNLEYAGAAMPTEDNLHPRGKEHGTKYIKATRSQSVRQGDTTLDCAIFDLTKWERPSPTLQSRFHFCGRSKNGGAVHILVWSDNRWQFVEHQHPYDRHDYQLIQTKYIHDYGYYKETRESNKLFYHHHHHYVDGEGWPKHWCGKTGGSPQSLLEIMTDEKFIVEYITLGTIPQLFNTLASIGGSISILTLIFFQIFPKKYPDGAVSKEYEKRTWLFASHRAKKKKTKDESTAQPVAKQDAGAVRTSRRLSGVPPLPKPPRPSQVGAKPLLPGPPGM